MGEGERGGKEKRDEETGFQGTRVNETSDNFARFDEDGNPVTRDDWIEGIFQVGDVPDLNDRKDEWVRERFIDSGSISYKMDAFKSDEETLFGEPLFCIEFLSSVEKFLEASNKFSEAIGGLENFIASEISGLVHEISYTVDEVLKLLGRIIEKFPTEVTLPSKDDS